MNILFKLFGGSYDDLWKAIIRPNRDEYNLEELGPFKFEYKGKCYKRTDFELINKRSKKIMCSFWEPFDEERESPRLPCVIYLHGNSSSRCEVYPEVKFLLERNITVFSFDFCGCGKSEGDYITLGYYEKRDVHCIVEYLLKSRKISKIALWGRSMGAVTAIMYANEHPKLIEVMILDSGFYSLKKLISELIESKIKLPKFIFEKVLKMVKSTVKEKANFDLDIIEPYIYAKNCLVPAFFCHGSDDNFVLPHHCVDLFNEYKCNDKYCEIVKGGHNSVRPKDLRIKICDYLMKYLKDDDLESNCTINNSNTYERIGLNDQFFQMENDYNINGYINNINNKKNIMSHSLNIIDLKTKVVKKNINNNMNKKQNKSDYKHFLNGFDTNAFNATNEFKISTIQSQDIKIPSKNKYIKKNLNFISKKNTMNNINNHNLKNNTLNYKKTIQNEENISSSSSSNLEEKQKSYRKKNIKKKPFNSIKMKAFPDYEYFCNNTNKSKKCLNKLSLNKKINTFDLNKNPNEINKINKKNYSINNSKINITNSFLKNVIKNTPILKNKKEIKIYNSFLKNNIIKNTPPKTNKIPSKEEKIFSENFFIRNGHHTNIIQNNYFTTNNIIFNSDIPIIKKLKKKKSHQKYNFSYTLKKPEDNSQIKNNRDRDRDRVKYFRKLEIRKNLIFKSFDIKKAKQTNILNKSNFNKNFKKYSKNSIRSTGNNIMDENEEEIIRKKIPH